MHFPNTLKLFLGRNRRGGAGVAILYSNDMETPNISQLKADPKNPRFISKVDFENLQKTIAEFGDLSGIVRNVQTDELVGGHQRVQAFKTTPAANIQITQRFDVPTKTGTVAVGYVVLNGEMFGYREVDWPRNKQRAANIAANRISGDWDKQLLAENAYELSLDDDAESLLSSTGMDSDEIDRLLKSVSGDEELAKEDDNNSNSLTFLISREQREIIEEALDHIKANREIPATAEGSMNGSALYYMARDYLDRLHGLVGDEG